MVTKQPEVTDATRKKLLEAFCKFYRIKPIEKISVRAIVNEAGYSRATFYNYFSDPYALLDYIEESLIRDVAAAIQSNDITAQNPESFVRAFGSVVRDNQTYLSVFTNPQGAASLAEKMKGIASAQLAHELGIELDSPRQRLAFEFYISGFISTMGSWLADPNHVSVNELAEMIEGILWHGIFSELK